MNELTFEPNFKVSETWGQIIRRDPAICALCGKPFQAPFMDLTGTSGGKLVGGLLSTRACPCIDGKALVTERRSSRPNWDTICPPHYAEFNFEKLPEVAKRHAAKVFDLASQIRHDARQGLGLKGPSDHGKSMLIHEVAKGFWASGWDIHLTFSTEFANNMANTRRRNEELDRCCNAKWLLIDDIGKGKMTDRAEADLWHVLEVRERWHRPLLCTVNSSGAALADNMSEDRGEPIVNRLRRLAHFIAIV